MKMNIRIELIITKTTEKLNKRTNKQTNKQKKINFNTGKYSKYNPNKKI
jgi:hypothetical protein